MRVMSIKKKNRKHKNKHYPYTKEELTEYLINKRDELGKVPAKKDIPEQMRPYYRVYFGKWCYALEETGIVIPSERTLERRARKKEKYDELHKMLRERAKEKKRIKALNRESK